MENVGHTLLESLFGYFGAEPELYVNHLSCWPGGKVLEERFLDYYACDDIVLLLNEAIE